MGIDRLDGDDARLSAAHDRGPDAPNDRELRLPDDLSAVESDRRAEYYAKYRAKVDAEYRAAAIDRGCDQVREAERSIITPEMRRIEAEDPDRHLVGFERRLKDKDRLTEKVTRQLDAQPDLTPDEAFANVKDAIRYTFQYSEERYQPVFTWIADDLRPPDSNQLNVGTHGRKRSTKGSTAGGGFLRVTACSKCNSTPRPAMRRSS
jgi:hypothetical protein